MGARMVGSVFQLAITLFEGVTNYLRYPLVMATTFVVIKGTNTYIPLGCNLLGWSLSCKAGSIQTHNNSTEKMPIGHYSGLTFKLLSQSDILPSSSSEMNTVTKLGIPKVYASENTWAITKSWGPSSSESWVIEMVGVAQRTAPSPSPDRNITLKGKAPVS